MLVLLAPPVFSLVARGVIGLPADVAGVSARAMIFLVLWPGSIGYRRFYQGILIRRGRPRAVTAGTIIRLSTMAAVGAALGLAGRMEGASVGAAALGAGVLAEAAASRFMARRSVRELKAMPEADCGFGRDLTRSEIGRFCFPLSLTSFLALAINPMTTFFLGRSRFPLESLAVLPVVSSLAFLFRTLRHRLPGGLDRPARRPRRSSTGPPGIRGKGRPAGLGGHGPRPLHARSPGPTSKGSRACRRRWPGSRSGRPASWSFFPSSRP